MRSNIQTPQFPHTLSLYFPHFTPSWNLELDDVDDVNVVMRGKPVSWSVRTDLDVSPRAVIYICMACSVDFFVNSVY